MSEIPDKKKEKIIETLNKFRQQLVGHDLSDFISTDNNKLIECKHEIIISVVASVFEEDEETGHLVGAKEISKKNYHIPVPSNKDYNEYLVGFFKFLENCMTASINNLDNKEDIKND